AMELKLFDHLQQLEEIAGKDNGALNNIEQWIRGMLDQILVDREIERRLDANFLQVITDIDNLVKKEYRECTGKHLKSAVFDKEKLGGQAEEAKDDVAISKDFIKKYNKRSSRELAGDYLKLFGIPTFEDVAAVTKTDEFSDLSRGGPETLFSSYTVEMAESDNLIQNK